LSGEAHLREAAEEARRIAEADENEDIADWIAAAGPTDWDEF